MPTRAIKSIFYTRFHPSRGAHVLHQVPPGSIVPSSSPSALPQPLIHFPSLAPYLIPTQQFTDRLLTFVANKHRIIGYPVCIRQQNKYERNEFIFNFAVVVGEGEADWGRFGEVVRKLGRLCRGLEEQGGFLSRDEEGEGGKVYALCEMVAEDLNVYGECMIPIDDSNTINLKLFPTRPPPPPIVAHQVPLLTISLASLQTPISSDLTLNRILPFINGIHSISRIAQLADTDLSLTRRAVQHLVYYGCLVLLDVFSFSAIYAPTAEISGFVVDDEIKDECLRYIRVPSLRLADSTAAAAHEAADSAASRKESMASPTSSETPTTIHKHASSSPSSEASTPQGPDYITLITLYTSLRQGQPLKSWVLQNTETLRGIDVRRLITFGLIKGFLYRVHKYAIATTSVLPPAPPTSLATSTANLRDEESATPTVRGQHRDSMAGAGHAHANANAHPTFSIHRPSTVSINPPFQAQTSGEGVESGEFERENALPLLKYLDGMHCFDEICTELGLSEKVVEGKVRGMGEGLGVIVQR